MIKINMLFSEIYKLFRVNHYIKNLLIFTPVIFLQNKNFDNLFVLIISFIIFCLVASSVYIFNDINDINNDKKHPEKSKRPIAKETITIKQGYSLIILLLLIALPISFFFRFELFTIILLYIFLNFLYTSYLKKIIYLDVCILASFYIIRVIIGFFVLNITISIWFILYNISIFMMIAFIKRLSELVLNKGKTSIYKSKMQLRIILFILLVISNLILIIYFFSPNFNIFFDSKLSFLLLILSTFSFNFIWINKAATGSIAYDPVKYIFSNRINIFIIMFSLTMIIYLIKI